MIRNTDHQWKSAIKAAEDEGADYVVMLLGRLWDAQKEIEALEAIMSNNVSVPKKVLENVIAVLRMYSESDWGWDGDDNSVVRSWGEVYPEPKEFHFKAGGDMAKVPLYELQRILTSQKG